MSRAFLVAGALLVSSAMAHAEQGPAFSPELVDPPMPAASAPAPAAAPVAEAAPAPRGKTSRRRTRLARERERRVARAAAELSRSVDPLAGIRHLTVGSIPAPLPPGRDDKVSDAVATLEAPPPGGNVEAAAATPGTAAAAAGAREAASHSLAEMLARHAFEEGVPVALAKAVVRIESGGNARASNHGALGLMQIKWATARAVGFSGPAAALLVADTNLRFGMKVLAQAYHDAHGDLCGALMRYQSGHLARHPSAANRAYCARARSLMARG